MKEKRDYDFKMPEAEMEIKINAEIPNHPGSVFTDFLRKAKLDEEPANKIARILGISRSAYYDFLNEENGISPEMAVRLARFFLSFDSSEYPGADDPYFWWDLNNKWLFFYSLKNPKAGSKKKNIGLIRYCVNGSTVGERWDNSKTLIISKEISMELKEISEDE